MDNAYQKLSKKNGEDHLSNIQKDQDFLDISNNDNILYVIFYFACNL